MSDFRTAVIPCAGRGTRLRPLLGERPKALLEIGGRSILAHAIAEARSAGLDRIVVVANPDARDQLHREARRWADTVDTVEQAAPRGLADALRCGARAAAGEPFAALLPDNLFTAPSPLARLLAIAAAAGEHAVLVARLTGHTASGKGGSAPATVEPFGPEGDAVRITAVGSKRGRGRLDLEPGERIDTPIGRYAFQPDVLPIIEAVERELPPGQELDDVPVLGRLAARHRLLGLLYETPFADVGNPEGYLAAHARPGA